MMASSVEIVDHHVSESLKKTSKIKLRWIVFTILAIQVFILASIKNSMSLAVVAMIEDVSCTIDNSTGVEIKSKGCFESDIHRKFHVDWNESQKSHILQAYIWGSIGMAIFGGRMVEIYGARKFASIGILVTGLLNFLFPTLALKSYYASYFIRLAQGVCSAMAIPTSQVILTHWVPQQEKTIASSILLSGGLFGNAITHPMVGLMVSGDFLGGWPLVFYFFGSLAITVSLLVLIFIRDDPGQHPFISENERDEIIQHRLVKSGKPKSLPWSSLLTSPAIYAVLVANFCYNWSAGFFSQQLSSFYRNVLNVSHKSNGFMTALPYIVSIMVNFLAGYLIDWLRSREVLTTIKLRKIATVVGYGVAASCLFLIPSVGKHCGTVVILATIAKGFVALNVAGPGSNHLDICPSFAGTFHGLSRTITDLSQILMNESVAILVGNNPTPKHWYNTFYLSAVLTIVGASIFVLLGSGKVQHWDPSSRKTNVNGHEISVNWLQNKKPEANGMHVAP